ncbi:MAG: TetR/AcrR family transcriptional regulator [Flavitalea sp.]
MRPIMIIAEIKTRERIRHKADELFMRYGLRSVSMDDIANSLGISKKTIYQFFADKNELVDAVLEETLNYNTQNCDRNRSDSANAVEEIFLSMDIAEQIFRNMHPSVIYDMQKYHPQAFARFLKHKNDYLYNIISKNLQRGIKEELYRPEIDIGILSRFRVESMLMTFNPEFYHSQKHNLAEVEQQLIEHYLYGIASLKGHKLILKYQQDRTKKHQKK